MVKRRLGFTPSAALRHIQAESAIMACLRQSGKYLSAAQVDQIFST
jgi:hypothetical protein